MKYVSSEEQNNHSNALAFKDFVRRFKNATGKTDTDAKVEINGVTYQLKDIEKIAEGAEKHVYKLPHGQCIFLPSPRLTDKETWKYRIELEKNIFDSYKKLGLKVQEFEIVKVEFDNNSMDVLIAKEFDYLCKNEHLIIWDSKGGGQGHKFIGDLKPLNPLYNRLLPLTNDIASNQINPKDREYILKLFEKAIDEYMTSLTFSIPHKAIVASDDDCHPFLN